MAEQEPIACSLDGDELEARLAAAGRAGRAALISRERTDNRHELRFRGGRETRALLEQIVRAERECCPFLSLALEARGAELVLSIEAPAGAEASADGLAAAFDAAAQ